MIQIEIRDKACRGCQICVDICPTDVLEFNDETQKATVCAEENCIGCLSCAYDCPSGAFVHTEIRMVKNFYRDLDFCERMEKFL